MDFSNFKPNGVAKSEAFEAMCNHLFESWLRREYKNELSYFTTVNGSGGDGGVEVRDGAPRQAHPLRLGPRRARGRV